jgi:hypothetical protein
MSEKAQEYRKHAEECMRLARQVDREEHRKMVLQMAQTWLKLAEERERFLDNKRLLEAVE